MDYIAVIGDIKKSKKIQDRFEVQSKLDGILNHVNERYAGELAAQFVITLGDEFQGLLCHSDHLLDIIKYIQREMYPVELRFGVGIGEIYTSIVRSAAIGADGPAYYAARQMIEAIREIEKRMKEKTPDIQIQFYKDNTFEIEEINTMLSLVKIIEDGWNEPQRLTIWDMQMHGGSQEDCARRMNTTQPTIARRLATGNYVIYEKTIATIKRAISTLEGDASDI